MTVFKSILTGLVIACTLVAPAAAQTPRVPPSAPPLCPPCLHDQMLSSLPASIELVIAVNNAAAQRESPAGVALTALMDETGALAETRQAWTALARTLDWSPERTFDELLGRRVSLIARGLNSPEGPQWAVLSAVSAPTEWRLRERLRAAPRGAVVGLSVLAIEDGSFQFVVVPCATSRSGDARSVILLAPRRCEALLDELAPVLRTADVPPDPAGRPCDIVVAMRPPGGVAHTLAITATALESGWDASIVCDPALVLPQPTPQVPSWSDAAFRSLEQGSLLAMMSVAVEDSFTLVPAGVLSWKKLLVDLAGEQAGDSLRTAVFIRSAPPMSPNENIAVRRVSSESPSASGSSPRLCITVAAETSDLRQAMVRGDLAMARFATMLVTNSDEVLPGAPRLQVEVLDSGPRSLRIGEDFAVHPALEESLARAFGDEPTLNWMTAGRPGRSGWWIASLSPATGGSGGGAREYRAFTAAETGSPKPRLAIGSVRPAALLRLVSTMRPEASVPGASQVDSIKWDSWLRSDGMVEASVSIRMVATSRPLALPRGR